MTKRQVRVHKYGSAAHVAAHAAWRAHRGHGPSMMFRKIRNPQAALAQAKKELAERKRARKRAMVTTS